MKLFEALFALINPASVLIFLVLVLVKFVKHVLETLLAAENQGHNMVCAELRQQLRRLTNEYIILREQQACLEQAQQDMNLVIVQMQCKLREAEERLALINQKFAVLSSQIDVSATAIHNGEFLWKIADYQKRWQGAVNGIDRALFSPPFYSAQHGYKMCAVIFLNGDGAGERSHLSLFFVVMRGDYDALQTWPFQKKITMMLLDQGNKDHKIVQFHSDPQSSSFQRPKSDMNIPSGFPLFMPLDSLNNRQYIKDDVMFIKVIVD